MRIEAKLVTIALVLVLVACSSFTEGKKNAEIAVGLFHRQLNGEHYGDIYNRTHQKFRDTVTEQDATVLFEAVHRKLGTVKTETLAGWRVNATTEGTFITLNYTTEFTEGKATEVFIYLANGENVSLVNYNINSPLLITK